MELKMMNLRDLKPYPKNAKKHPQEQIKNVAESIKEFGWQQPIVVDEQNVIIIGHCRYQAAKLLKLETVPVHVAKGLDENQVNKLRLLDNKTNESEWDFDLLLEQIPTLEFDNYEIDWGIPEEENEVEEDDFDVDSAFDEIEEPISKPGDIYLLGGHRLMCGDSTSIDDVEKLMNGNKADMVFTDPPYRMEAQGGSNQWVGRQAAKLGESIKELCDFEPTEFLNRLKELFENKMNAYIFCNKDLVPDYLNWSLKNNYAFNILFWKKPNALPLGGQHRPDTEYLLFFRKNAIWNNGLENVSYSKCLEFGRDNSTPHPTMKPLELIGNELKISSNENSNIVDLFGGSGSTLIACEQLNRNCYMMELDPKYVDVIIKRWETFTGKKAEKIN